MKMQFDNYFTYQPKTHILTCLYLQKQEKIDTNFIFHSAGQYHNQLVHLL